MSLYYVDVELTHLYPDRYLSEGVVRELFVNAALTIAGAVGGVNAD